MTDAGVVDVEGLVADRDRWRDMARQNLREIKQLRRRVDELEPVAARHDELMKDLAGHLVPALKEARYVQVNPAGVPTKGNRK
ncbi:hypothetical protein [Herbiconiux sp. VKM Ac-2851]|uniref:hypothetical protein n=1 Tax=Herbiconiux sp. VKM Ac-2851 TaxID=2739025 RepID=UPI001563C260|nr:hypothetical protein [Herbiconiux sp. VKM Ac-2851]NQX35474.1 hypothetical protein [Herbiconiux sp. VKM Ac-2851]